MFTLLKDGDAAVLDREIGGTTVPWRCAQAPSSLGTGRSEGKERSGAVSTERNIGFYTVRRGRTRHRDYEFPRLPMDTDNSKIEDLFRTVQPTALR